MNLDILSKIKEENKNIITQYGHSPISITKVIEMLNKPFDQQGVAQKTYDKNFNNPDSKYYQMSIDEILESWSNKAAESCSYGRKLDEYIQSRLEDKDLELWKLDNNFDYDDRLNGICSGFEEFISELSKTDYEDVGGEIQVFYNCNGVLVNGRMDRLFYSPSQNKFLVVDWKNSGDIALNNKWDKLLGPMMNYDACNGNTYTLQTHFYKTCLINSYPSLNITEDNIDVKIVQMVYGDSLTKHFNEYNENFKYSKTLMDKTIDFAYKKNQILNKNS